jgi:tape measure domain-containing protein
MAETEQLVVQLEARIRDFERNMQRASKSANDNFGRIEKRGAQAAQRLQTSMGNASAGVTAQLNRMATVSAGALSAALGSAKLKEMADVWSGLANRISAAGETMSNVATRQNQVADIAIRSRSDLEATGDLYTGLKRSTEELGASQAQVARATETVSKAFSVGGQSAETVKGAITQLNQAFASGALRGDELNSVLEGAPSLARLIAKEFGVTTGELKKLGEAGALTSDRVFGAILKGSAAIDAEFSKTNSTIAQSFTNLSTAMTRYIGQLDQATGASSAIAAGINGMASNMNVAAPLALTLGAALAGFAVGGPIGAGIAGIVTALATMGPAAANAVASVQPLAGSFATIGDYAAVAFDMVKDQGAEAVEALQQGFAQAADYVTAALSGINVGDAFASLLAGVKATVNAVIGSFIFAAKAIVAAWSTLGGAIGEMIVSAMNGVVSTIESAINQILGAVNKVTAGVNSMAAAAGINLNLGTVGEVSLGRVTNNFEGAGKAAGEAFSGAFSAFGVDYVGQALDVADQKMKQWTSAAEKQAENRREIERRNQQNRAGQTRNDGTLDQRLKAPPADSKGGAGGGGGKGAKGGAGGEAGTDFDKEIARIAKRAASMEAERQALGRGAMEAEKAAIAFRLLEAAKQANVPITDELKGRVDQLATAYANAKTKLDQAKEQQQAAQQGMQQLGGELTDSISDLVVEGKSLNEVFDNLAKSLAKAAIQAALMGSGPLAGILGMGGTGGKSGGLLGMLFGGIGFADGGSVRGPGTSRSDSIPAMLSDGEFVVNAQAAGKNRALLEAINTGRVPHLADGGLVGAGSTRPAIGTGASQITTIAPNITVNASGGTKEQNDDLAGKIGRQVQHQLRGLIASEMKSQMRPGGLLRS